MPEKIVIAGGTGFIGQALGRRWRERGCEVVVLTRREARRRGDGVREVSWSGQSAGSWVAELEGAAALVNLAGSTINCVHTEENRQRILRSRLDVVGALGAAVRGCRQPPPVWVQASAVGFYGSDTGGGKRCREDAPPGGDFLAGVCRQWEEAFARARPEGVRPVLMRIGVVLGRRGGALPPLVRLARLFLGGAAGGGRQGISWIHLADLEEMFLQAVADPGLTGVYNACGPAPLANREFMATLRGVLGRPWCPPAPAVLVGLAARWILRTEPGLALRGQYAEPARLLAAGWKFRFPRLEAALENLVRKGR